MEIKATATEKTKRDYLLVSDALNGDQKAYAELMNFYREPLYFMLVKMCNNPYDAEDLTIEAFGKAFKNLEKYSGDFAFSTWLFRIAANNCIDFMRRKMRAPLCIDDEVQRYENNVETVTPEEDFMDKQRITMMHFAVDQLRPKYRELVTLRYFEEFSYEEIAQTLDITIPNVKIQLFRAKEMLYTIMKNVKHAI